jgi:hypothetical protein
MNLAIPMNALLECDGSGQVRLLALAHFAGVPGALLEFEHLCTSPKRAGCSSAAPGGSTALREGRA